MNESENSSRLRRSVTPPWRPPRIQIGFLYVLTLICALVMGWFFPQLLDDVISAEQGDALIRHFTLPFDSLSTPYQIFFCVLSFAAPSLICTGLVFLFSFSSLNRMTGHAVLLFCGSRTGYAVRIVWNAFWEEAALREAIGFWRMILFLIWKLLFLCILLGFVIRATEYAYDLRAYAHGGRTPLYPKTACFLLLSALFTGSLLLGAHALYSWLLFLLSR